jgi:hypothetical protein
LKLPLLVVSLALQFLLELATFATLGDEFSDGLQS